jgi:hypothetical protein
MNTEEDDTTFGVKFVYCNQHLSPHSTGWCTVYNYNKIPLDAQILDEAFLECKAKGYKLYNDKN